MASVQASPGFDSSSRSFGELVKSQSFRLGDGGRVEIDLEDADVVLETISGPTLELRVYVDASDEDRANSLFDDMEFRAVQTGTTVSIVAREPRFDRSEWRRRSYFSVTAVVGVPRGVEIDAQTGDGDIRINLLASSEVSVSTGDGDITVTAPADLAADVYLEGEDLSVAEGLELLGRIRSHSVQGTLNGGGPNLELRTGDGAITLRQGN